MTLAVAISSDACLFGLKVPKKAKQDETGSNKAGTRNGFRNLWNGSAESECWISMQEKPNKTNQDRTRQEQGMVSGICGMVAPRVSFGFQCVVLDWLIVGRLVLHVGREVLDFFFGQVAAGSRKTAYCGRTLRLWGHIKRCNGSNWQHLLAPAAHHKP